MAAPCPRGGTRRCLLDDLLPPGQDLDTERQNTHVRRFRDLLLCYPQSRSEIVCVAQQEGVPAALRGEVPSS